MMTLQRITSRNIINNLIRVQWIAALIVSLLSYGCFTLRLDEEVIEIRFLSVDEIMVGSDRVQATGLSDYLRHANYQKWITILFKEGNNLQLKDVFKVKTACAVLGFHSYAFEVNGDIVPTVFGCVEEDRLFVTDPNRKVIRLEIEENGIIFNKNKVLDMRDLFNKICYELKTDEEEVAEIVCDRNSSHGSLLQVLAILREARISKIFIVSL
jgi:biopolymer transport protein ExbD